MSKNQLRQQRKVPKARFCEWRGLNFFQKNLQIVQVIIRIVKEFFSLIG